MFTHVLLVYAWHTVYFQVCILGQTRRIQAPLLKTAMEGPFLAGGGHIPPTNPMRKSNAFCTSFNLSQKRSDAVLETFTNVSTFV